MATERPAGELPEEEVPSRVVSYGRISVRFPLKHLKSISHRACVVLYVFLLRLCVSEHLHSSAKKRLKIIASEIRVLRAAETVAVWASVGFRLQEAAPLI